MDEGGERGGEKSPPLAWPLCRGYLLGKNCRRIFFVIELLIDFYIAEQ
jgi:hypothetical protein